MTSADIIGRAHMPATACIVFKELDSLSNYIGRRLGYDIAGIGAVMVILWRPSIAATVWCRRPVACAKLGR